MRIGKWTSKGRLSAALALCCVLGMIASAANGDVIVDNGDVGASFTGTWQVSGGTSPYGTDSVWARDGAAYTWAFDSEPAGNYEVLMWWSAWPSRAAAIDVSIGHAGGAQTLVINQQNAGGQWSSLGEYYFEGAGSVMVTAASGAAVSTCADAVWFRLVSGNAPPTAYIDSISPNPTTAGQMVAFAGSGEDSDGDVVAYNWASSIDGHLSDADSFSTDALSEGVHEITFEVQDDAGQRSQPAVEMLTVGAAPVEVIVDNRDGGTSATGTWEVSGGPDPYGADSVFGRDGETFTWYFTPPRSGDYEVSMWWTQWPSRSTAAPIDIVHASGTERVTVNQQASGGQWNILGVYAFSAGVQGSVTLSAPNPSPTSYSADAVKFTLVQGNEMPLAVIDSMEPNPATVGESVAFAGHGTDPDGQIVAYRWASSIDGHLSDADSFSTDALSEGVHEITFEVQGNASQWSQAALANLVVGGVSPAEIIVDNRDGSTSATGTWAASGGPNPYGADSVWSRDGATFTWYFTPAQSGNYEVAMWWTQWPSRSTAVPIDIVHASGTERVTVNQQTSGGQWNILGVYAFSAGVQGSVTLSAPNPSPTSYSADAVKFTLVQGNEMPLAVIDSMEPNPATVGESVAFAGHGIDSDGQIAGYRWESSVDGHLSDAAGFSTSALSEGTHEITFTVRDNRDQWSQAVSKTLVIGGATPAEVIIDNGDPGTSSVGVWLPSGAAGYYGANCLYSRDGTRYTWMFTPPVTGLYELSMWWTEWSSRTTNAQVSIVNADGTATAYINQQANGGRWNRLGEYYYNAGTAYGVTITSASGSASTCADAVRFVKVPQAGAPAAGFYADRVRGGAPFNVQFYDQSSGAVSQWRWDFGDGQYSNERSPAHAYSKAGLHTVSLTVTGPNGTSKKTLYDYIDIKPSTTEHIYLIDGYGGNAYFMPDVAKMLRSLRAAETADGWRYQPSSSNMTYYMHRVHNTDAFKNALNEQDAHIIVAGHANFGFGTTFATSMEIVNQRMDDVYFVDDDHFVNYSSDMVSTKIDGMKYGQAYPNWEPVLRNGQSALMPYDFGDPRGNPPYNYYLKYQIPGDPTVYKIELPDGSYLERFPDASTPVWFSEDGSPPDPVKNPEYFIRNTDADYNRCDFVGSWPIKKVIGGGYTGAAGYLGYNYQVRWPGSGNNKAIWTLVIKYPGTYMVMGSWYPSLANASNARYTVVHGNGTSVANVDQRTTALINPIGAYYFGEGSYTITLDDYANGQVVADAILLNPLENPAEILSTDFTASETSGPAGLAVQFNSRSTYYNLSNAFGGVVEWYWDFGDGSDSNSPNPRHVYSSPGIYTVSLDVKTGTGSTAAEVKKNFISVGLPEPLEAEFTALSRLGSDRTVVNFIDQSCGDITGWHWDFGDGQTSTEQNPVHVYDERGTYAVTLAVSGSGGSDTEVEEDFIYNVIGLIYADNTSVGKPHFYSRSGVITFGKIICYTGDVKIQEEDLKYSRMFHGACNSFQYFAEAFHRGVMFAKIKDVVVEHDTSVPYLEYYLRGYTDRDILDYVNSIENIHQLYNFNEKPPSMR